MTAAEKRAQRAAYERARYAANPNPEKKRTARLKYRYGLAPTDIDAMRATQNSACAICCEPAELHVDHCHKTQRVRGLLCRHCNLMLGYARDNPDVLSHAREYLARTAPTSA